MSKSKHVQIKVGPVGVDSVIIEGTDITDLVDGVQVTCEEGAVTTVYLRMRDARVEVEGITLLGAQTEAVSRGTLMALLDQLNPEVIEAHALSSLGWGEEGTLTAKVIEAIKEAIGSGPERGAEDGGEAVPD